MVLFETILKCKFLNIKELREVINVFEMIVITYNHVIDCKKHTSTLSKIKRLP